MGYFSGQGRVYIAERSIVTPGEPDVYRWVGNSPEFTLNMEVDVEEHRESWTGQKQTDLRLLQERRSNLTMVLEDFSAENLALALFGNDSAISGTSIVDESLAGGATTIVVGDFLTTKEPKISAVDIKDSAGTPASLVEGTDFRIHSADHGTIEIIGDLSGYTLPLTIDYTSAASTNIRMFSQRLTEKWVRFDGINTAESDVGAAGDKVVAEFYRVSFDPTEALEFIGDTVAQFTLNGSALVDDDKTDTDPFGLFGRIILL